MRFLTRAGCHLCEEAEPTVRRASRLVRAGVVEIDVDSDPEMAVEWGLRIPVVLDREGEVLAEGRIGFWPLLRSLIGARRGGV